MGAAGSAAPRAVGTANAAIKPARKVIKTALRREDIMRKPQYRQIKKPVLAEMDAKVLHEAERFEETVDKIEFLETDMTAFKNTAAGNRAKSDGPVPMPVDKTQAANSQTYVDDVPGRFTDRQFRELLRLYRENPQEWTESKLAAHYKADVTTIHHILTHCCPPMIVPPTSSVTYPLGKCYNWLRTCYRAPLVFEMEPRDGSASRQDDPDAVRRMSRRESRRDSMALADVVNNLTPENAFPENSENIPVEPTLQERLKQLSEAFEGGWRYRVRQLLENPSTTRLGRLYQYTIISAIVGNFIPMMLESMDGPANGGSDPYYPYLPSADTYFYWEIFFSALFGMDLVLKIIVAKRQRQFWTRLITWIDVLGILPLPASIIMKYGLQWTLSQRKKYDEYFKLFRLFRIVRVTYMLREVDGIKVLFATMHECVLPLRITFFFLITIVMMFATLLFFCEPCYDKKSCPFTDIFNAGYFVMVSVTTVGYGDQVPTLDNVASVIVTCCILIFGALYLAMPLAIIGIKYELMWMRYEIKVSTQRSLSSSKSTLKSMSRMKTTSEKYHHHHHSLKPLPTEALAMNVHHVYLAYLNLTKEMNHLHGMVTDYVNIPAEEIFTGYHNRLHNESLEKLHHACKHVIQIYHKFMNDMRDFQPTGMNLPPGEEREKRQSRSRSSSFTSYASGALNRARHLLHPVGGNNHTLSTSGLSGKESKTEQKTLKLSFRRRLRHILEHPHKSGHGKYLNGFFYFMVFLSVLMFYAETAPELQAHGPTSTLCQDAIKSYCTLTSRFPETDPGCFVWDTEITCTKVPINFDCKPSDKSISNTSSPCYGSGWNFGSALSKNSCTTIFSEPQFVCGLRQCQLNHSPILDMTSYWIYLEFYFALVFTIEFLMRLYATKYRGDYLRSIGPWLNLGAIIPFYTEMAYSMLQNITPSFAIVSTFPTFLSVLPILKTLRILKMGKHLQSSVVLSRTASLTYRRLMIPLFFLFLGCISAGAIFYEVERGTQCKAHKPCLWWGLDIMTPEIAGQFPVDKRIQVQFDKLTILTDMWRSTWMSIVTFTTVGFGDMKPRTPLGRLIDIVATIIGSIYTAMPLSLIGGQFYFCYEQFVKQQQQQNAENTGLSKSMGKQRAQSRIAHDGHHVRERDTPTLSVDDIDILKKCGVVVLLLDEMMQNMYKINRLTPHPASLSVAHEDEKHHHIINDLTKHKSLQQLKSSAAIHQPSGGMHRRPSDLSGWRRISGGSLASMFNRAPQRIVPTNQEHHDHDRDHDHNNETDKMKQLMKLRNLIQVASTHLTTILLQLTRVMEKVVLSSDGIESQNSSNKDSHA